MRLVKRILARSILEECMARRYVIHALYWKFPYWYAEVYRASVTKSIADEDRT